MLAALAMKGYVHVYTGNGKGKTTAAFGLALRAVGAGKKVYIGQFVKGQAYSEIQAVSECLPGITVKQLGLGCFIINEPTQADIDAARQGLTEVADALHCGLYDMVILDEVTIALFYKLLSVEEVLEVVASKPEATEVVLTGRYAPQELIDAADLVTEMREVKHYYTSGVEARVGIEC